MELQDPKIRVKQNLWIFTMMLAYMLSNAGNSCINPFYPKAAINKGVSESIVGIVMGLVYLPQLIMMICNQILINKIGPVNLLKIGIFLTFSSTMAFGLTDMVNSKLWFIIICLCLKLVQGIGYSFIATVSVFIAAEYLSDRMSFVVGLLETGSGIGYTIGPVIGGYIEDKLGYAAPLLIIGGLECIIFFISVFSMRNIPAGSKLLQNEGEKIKIMSLLKKIPVIFVLLFINALPFLIMCSYDIFIPLYGSEQLHTTSSAIGFSLFVPAIAYSIAAMITGRFIDKKGFELSIVVVGLALLIISNILLALLKIYTRLPLVIVSVLFTVMSCGCSACYVPILSLLKKVLCSNGIAIDQDINAFISSAMITCLIIGQLLGSAIAGVLYEHIGMANAEFLYAAIAFVLIFVSVFGVRKSKKLDYSDIQN